MIESGGIEHLEDDRWQPSLAFVKKSGRIEYVPLGKFVELREAKQRLRESIENWKQWSLK